MDLGQILFRGGGGFMYLVFCIKEHLFAIICGVISVFLVIKKSLHNMLIRFSLIIW